VAQNGLGQAEMQLGKFDDCLASFTKAIDLATQADAVKDTLGSYYSDRGFAYYIQGKFEAAKADYLQAAEYGYKLGETYAYIGVTVGVMGDDLKALDYLDQAVKADPEYHFAWSNRGYYHSKLGDNRVAIFDFSKAIELMPDDKMSFLNRGYTHIGMGDYESALRDIETALKLDPDYLEAIAYKGIALTNTGKSPEAVEWLTRAIEMQPDNPAFYYYRGLAYINFGEIDAGCKDLAMAKEGGHSGGEEMREAYCNGVPRN
jgi:tetratricopeptide (TPR) repeat protein